MPDDDGQQPPPEEPYEIPGTEPAWEPATLPDTPLTSSKVQALIPKVIG